MLRRLFLASCLLAAAARGQQGARFDLDGTAGLAAQGWSVTPAGAEVRICAPSALRAWGDGGRPLVPLGGDYWKVPTRTGQPSRCRLETQGVPGALIDSPGFTLATTDRFLTFFIGGGGTAATVVQLVVEGAGDPQLQRNRDGSFSRSTAVRLTPVPGFEHRGTGTLAMSRISWQVDRAELRGKTLHLRIADTRRDAGTDGLRVADLRLLSAQPAIPAAPPPPPPLFGLADLHTHLFAHIGFGGGFLAGKPHSAVDYSGAVTANLASRPSDALRGCWDQHGRAPDGKGVLTVLPEMGHDGRGWPGFEGWPRDTVSHQQMYVDWLRRAWQGGLRIMHMDALNNLPLAEKHRQIDVAVTALRLKNPNDDQWNIEKQAMAAEAFVLLPDVRGWAGVAHSAREARALVAAGKLALVLGAEVDDLGHFSTSDAAFQNLAVAAERDLAAREQVRTRLRAYLTRMRALGVVHLFPVHMFDNVFGGAAVYEPKLDLGNALFQRENRKLPQPQWLTTLVWTPGLPARFDLSAAELKAKVDAALNGAKASLGASALLPLVTSLLPLAGVPPDAAGVVTSVATSAGVAAGTAAAGVLAIDKIVGLSDGFTARMASLPQRPNKDSGQPPLGLANARGLSAAGVVFVEEAMKLGMVLDLSHMGERTAAKVIELARARRYPLISGHTGFREMALGSWKGDGTGIGPVGLLKQPRPSNGGDAFNALDDYQGGLFGTSKPENLGSERDLSPAQVQAIRDLGGMVGVGTGRAVVAVQRGGVRPDCDGSSKAFVNELRYAVEKMGGRGVAIGTDANGFVAGLLPRFGPSACMASADDSARKAFIPAQVREQRFGVRYADGNTPGGVNGAPPLSRCCEVAATGTSWQQAGSNKRFDYNTEGLAHYGLLPDLLQDVRNVGTSWDDLGVLMRSADDYVRMWEKIDQLAGRR